MRYGLSLSAVLCQKEGRRCSCCRLNFIAKPLLSSTLMGTSQSYSEPNGDFKQACVNVHSRYIAQQSMTLSTK